MGPLHVDVTFAGYRGQWIVQKPDIASGAHAQDLMPPRVPPAPVIKPETKQSARPPRDPEGPFDRDDPANAPPRLTIQYRILGVDPSAADQSSGTPTRQ